MSDALRWSMNEDASLLIAGRLLRTVANERV